MEEGQPLLTKETRKMRKVKKFIDEEEPTNSITIKKTQSSKKRKTKKAKETINKELVSTQPITTKNGKSKQKQDVGNNNKEKKTNILKDKTTNYDSIDEYDTDELIESSDKKTSQSLKNRLLNPSNFSKLKKVKDNKVTYNHERVQYLTKKYKDNYWKYDINNSPKMINLINKKFQIEIEHSLDHLYGSVLGMTLSEDGTALATFSIFGSVSVWDLITGDFKLIRKLRDHDEVHIDEFYCGAFKTDYLATAGKLKNRHQWCHDDDDNRILPCPIKIFNIISGEMVARLEGHEEEILCLKYIRFDNENYYISTSQDGYIIKWHMESDHFTLKEKITIGDGVTCMAFTISFLPNTGNKYFLGACDGDLKLYDFEEAQIMQVFENMYTSYCDCGKFIKWIDGERYLSEQINYQQQKKNNNNGKGKEPLLKHNDDDDDDVKKLEILDKDQQYAWFISRGAEWCDVSEGVSSIPNSCTLHRLIYPRKSGDPFKLEEVKKYKHEDYHSNSWLIKIASNGRYILAPTIHGQFYVFNMYSGQVAAVVKEHEDMEVRDIIVHPYLPLIFSSGDDGRVYVYTNKG